ncbi:hypothetical protein HOLleu_23248 [Holothuria leucospilota]|uniref:WSC domain-containing protein n=1 Tax=Holothuria leucospilota TaxID=206669 RepID=A0A9Q1BV19_HOLLE|nr:hypothetical protein HOLleu_23248 [Holothuria leucospilota]
MDHLGSILLLTLLQIHSVWTSPDYLFLGCYQFNHSLEPFEEYSYKDLTNTYKRCARRCSSLFLSYFVVAGKQCICTEDISKYINHVHDYCNTRCPGSPKENCGGENAVSIFAVVYCELVATPLNGFVEASTKMTMFFCSKGYQLHGEEVINCNNTLKQWDGPTDPLCLKTNYHPQRGCDPGTQSTNIASKEGPFANHLPYVILCVSASVLLVVLLLRENFHRKKLTAMKALPIRNLELIDSDQNVEPNISTDTEAPSGETTQSKANRTIDETDENECMLQDMDMDSISEADGTFDTYAFPSSSAADLMECLDTKVASRDQGSLVITAHEGDMLALSAETNDTKRNDINSNDLQNFTVKETLELHNLNECSFDTTQNSGPSKFQDDDDLVSVTDDENGNCDDYPPLYGEMKPKNLDIKNERYPSFHYQEKLNSLNNNKDVEDETDSCSLQISDSSTDHDNESSCDDVHKKAADVVLTCNNRKNEI